MRGLVGGIVLLAARLAAADEVVVARDASSGGRADVALDALGWAVEARVSIGDPSAHGVVDITDDRRTVRLELTQTTLHADYQTAQLGGDLHGTHVLRVEQAGGRTLLFVDGALLIDRDAALPEVVVDAPRGVSFEVRGPLRWDQLVVDTAPAQLAHSARPYRPATHFVGPFAAWLSGWAARGVAQRAALAAVVLPEKARACVAFAIVAAASRKRPKHLRLGELATEDDLVRMTMPVELDPFDGPRPARSSNHDLAAQAALRRALQAKDPREAYTQAIGAVVSIPRLPDDATEYLLAHLAPLARNPDACR